MILTGPTGNLIHGDVLDCGKVALERKLQEYDEFLYLKWNPKKRRGWGVWELRRRPELKKAVPQGTFQGMAIYSIEPVENKLEHHIKDVEFLNYDLLNWLKEADQWRLMDFERGNQRKVDQWLNDIDRNYDKHEVDIELKTEADLLYSLKQEKAAFRDLQDAILSGTNPAQIAQHWGTRPKR